MLKERKPDKWMGNLLGIMHNNRITYDDLGAELGVTKAYVSMILNGTKKPHDAQNRLEAAVDSIIEKRNTRNEQEVSV